MILCSIGNCIAMTLNVSRLLMPVKVDRNNLKVTMLLILNYSIGGSDLVEATKLDLIVFKVTYDSKVKTYSGNSMKQNCLKKGLMQFFIKRSLSELA